MLRTHTKSFRFAGQGPIAHPPVPRKYLASSPVCMLAPGLSVFCRPDLPLQGALGDGVNRKLASRDSWAAESAHVQVLLT